MKSFVTPFKVGLLILAAIAALIFMIGKMSQSAVKKGQGYTVYAIFNDATGLTEQSRVMMACIPIGTVTTIRHSGARARVYIKVRDEITLYAVKKHINADGQTIYINGVTIAKRQASLLGDYFL